MPRLSLFVVLATLLVAIPATAQPAVFEASRSSRIALSGLQASHLGALHGYQGEPQIVTVRVGVLEDGAIVRFNLTDGVELVTKADRVERFEKGALSWFGTVRDAAEKPTGQAIVSVRNGRMIGEFITSEGTYVLKPLGESMHALVRMDDEIQFESEEVDLASLRIEPPALRVPVAPSATREAGAPVYRVLFPYTASALDVVPDIALVAQQAIAYANQSYANSQVNLRAEFAGLFELDIPESGSLETDLGRLRSMTDGFGDAVHAERTRVGADMVTLFRSADNTTTAGIAYVCAQSASGAFGVFEVDGAGTSPVFTHEVGHIIGGGHEEIGSFGCDDYSRAKEEAGGLWRTVMFSAFSTQSTIPYFSNPSVSVEGTPTGDFNTRDNARTFNERAAVVSGFVISSGAAGVATAQPGSPTVQVVPGTTETVELALQNSGGGPFSWYGITSASPDFRFHTLGEIVQDEINAEGTALTTSQGSCSSGDDLTEGFATFEFGFPFPFDGEAYTQARVSPNGFVVFDGYDGCAGSLASSIPAAGGSDAFVSAFQSPDVEAVQSSSGARTTVYVKTLDDGRRAVTWTFVGFRIPDSNSFFPVDAQAIFGPDGSVELRYDSIFRILVGDTPFTSGETTYDPPLTTDILVGIEYADDDGAQVPFARLSSAGQILFPNPALELLEASRTVQAGQTGTVPVQINADLLPLGEFTIPLQLITNAPNAPILEIPIRVQVVTVIDTEDDPNATLTVEPIRPNPAVNEATVSFELATPSAVVVSVFDALGREVRRRDLGTRIAGADAVALDTRGLAPGVYVVRLEAGDAHRTRRLTVVR